jgi:Domain of unknown function (DUF4105)
MGRWLVRAMIGVLVVCVFLGATAWGVLALYYSDVTSAVLRIALATLFGVFGLTALVLLGRRPWRWRALGGFALVFAVLLVWWSSIAPSNDRDWKPEVAVLPYATIDGDRVTMHNIRNFDYRNETDFTPHYYDKTFDLRKLQSVDLIASYWAGPAIAHIFLSFGFGRNDYVAISIERRDERSEGYSAIKGLFKQYELFYVVADERDVIRLRTNFRHDPPEQVYLYRLRGSPDSARRVFRAYLREINSLREHPEFYNTLTTNCTGNIWLHARINPGHVPYSWKILASGYVPEYLYEQGRLDSRLPFAELQRRSLINALAQKADDAPDFSERIRANLAVPATGPSP